VEAIEISKRNFRNLIILMAGTVILPLALASRAMTASAFDATAMSGSRVTANAAEIESTGEAPRPGLRHPRADRARRARHGVPVGATILRRLVSARWTLSGTQRGEWNGVPATNRRLDATGLTMMRVKDDKIQETWSVLDLLLIGAKPNE
jgi:hypothetical protein